MRGTANRMKNRMRQFSDVYPKMQEISMYVEKMKNFLDIEPKIVSTDKKPLPEKPTDVEHTKRNKGQPIIRQMALFPYTIINSLVMRILETTKEEILWSSVLLVICSINGNLPNRFIYLF